MVEIIPSILTNSSDDLVKLIGLAENKVNIIQIDIIDGKFVNNKTIDPSVLNNIETDLKLDYHLMVIEPINWIERCVRAQANRIIGQIEKMSSQKKFIKKVKQANIRVGLAIDINTPVSMIDQNLLGDLDVILVMSVKAGFGGQDFDKKALKKIDELDDVRNKNNLKYKICDDGGVTLGYIDDVAHEGVDEVVIGRKIFKGNMTENILKFKKASKEK